MAKATTDSQEKPVTEAIEEILPHGTSYQMPQHLHQKLLDKPFLKESPSSFRVYLACPLRWYLERYAEIPPDDSPVDEYNRWGVLGNFVHRVMQLFYDEPAPLRTEKLLTDLFNFCMDELIDAGKTGAIESDLSKGYAYVIKNDPWHKRAPHKFGPFESWLEEEAEKLIFNVYEFDENPEETEILGNELWVNGKRNGVKFSGKIDKIEISPTGGLIIDDYKTGKTPAADEEVEITSESYIAMGMYGVFYENDQYPRKSKIRLLYLKTGDKYVINLTPRRIELVEEMLDRVTKQMVEVRETGSIMAVPANFSNAGQCAHCPASGECPAYQENQDDTGPDSFKPLMKNLNLLPLRVKSSDED